MSKTFIRFLKYFIVGFSTFLLDLALLYSLTSLLSFNYLWSAGVSYLIAVSINYILSRKLVFSQTERPLDTGYYFFVLIALVGALAVMGFMALLVSTLGFNYVVARILVAGLIGMGNYLINLFLNFKVAGIH